MRCNPKAATEQAVSGHRAPAGETIRRVQVTYFHIPVASGCAFCYTPAAQKPVNRRRGLGGTSLGETGSEKF
jgi:hypothetical protein